MYKLLLVVDVQKNFIPDTPEGKNLCSSIERLQKEYDFVAISKFINTPDSFWVKYLQWNEMMEGDPSTALAFQPVSHALIYNSNTNTSYTNNLQEYVKKHEISEIHVCGVDTEACVLATSFDLWDAKIDFKILINYCMSSAGDNLHSSAQHIMSKNFSFSIVKANENLSSK